MQCYQYLAATIVVANALESLPGIQQKLPPSMIANWIDDNGIEADDLISATIEDALVLIEPLLRQNQLPQAA